MPISVTGNWTTKTIQTGFTLLEVMVVLVVIGIVTGFAVLSVHYGSSERFDEEARRLEQLLTLARDEAIFRGDSYGVRFTPSSYGFYRLQGEGAWLPLTESEWFRWRELPPGMRLHLFVEGAEVDLVAVEKPQIYFLPSGESSLFEVRIDAPEQRAYIVRGDALGQLGTEPAR